VISGDDAPRTDVVVDDADDAALTLELGDVPDDLAQSEVIGTGGFADDLALDKELDGGLAGMIAARDEEANVRMRQLERRRGQRAGGGIAAVVGAYEGVASLVAELVIDAVDLADNRR
jgi:hypothetical protein